MREIKFRAYDGTEWVYSTTISYDEHDKQWSIYNNSTESWSYCGKPYQYTGLKDKNKKEIFEGDIVKGYYDEYNSFFDEVNRHEFISEVKYIDNSFKVHRNTLNDEGRIRDYGYVHEWDSELVDVIGNTYENSGSL